MKTLKITAVFIWLAMSSGYGQVLSGDAMISVLTLGPDQTELYSAFGHSAIRVNDPQNGWDVVYNYGIFDFDQPNFYLNFARGKLYYKLGLQRHDRFKRAYIRDNRSIIEQTLALDSVERQRLFQYLQWNAEPENANYYYNYIYDNCATKIRDVLDTVFNNTITYDYSYVKDPLTFRDLMDLYLGEQPWGDLGIDICLGIGIDQVASGYHYMYLPDYIERGFDGAMRSKGDTTIPLLQKKEVVYRSQPAPSKASTITPQVVFIGIFLFFGFISFKEVKRGKRTNWIDVLLFSVSGIVGWLLLFLWFLTDHISQYNFNLLWAVPMHFPIILLLLKKERPAFLRFYFLVNAILLGLVIALWGYWPQDLHDSLIPFSLLLLIRSILIHRDLNAISAPH